MISQKLVSALVLSVFTCFLSKAQKIALKAADVAPSQVTVKEAKYKNKNALVLEIQREVTNERH
ncbi:hypothetical protein [Chryseobacterium luteum]|uniref:hypothetical protein n=1 Tax=Chryseobacterium luteum TaxID=421531 RepID=UPI0005514AC2|nr:hypothetical protein [Chryseobacterium luteum]